MTSAAEPIRPVTGTPMQYRVLGPDSTHVPVADLRRLFRGERMTAARRNRLALGGRILAMCGSRVVGLAAYERADRDVRVYELGMDAESACGTDDIANGLLDALELACLASGARRLLLLPRTALNGSLLRRRGYLTVGAGHSGAWVEKTFA